jgi:hypothetical protein
MINLTSELSTKYCCEATRIQVEYVCEQHPFPYDCPDTLIYHSNTSDQYGLHIHDGGSSFVFINFCPFCGKGLSDLEK